MLLRWLRMSEKIKLYFKDELIGQLIYFEDRYIFKVVDEFSNESILSMLNFKKGEIQESNDLFYVFHRFIPDKNRTDIYSKADIKATDNEFQILLKVSKLNLDRDQFWIGG